MLTHDHFEWTSKAQLAFNGLKNAITTTLMLLLPNFTLPFILETGGSDVEMGVILSQHGHPIMFFSKPFSPKLLHASTYVRVLFTIIATVKK